MGIAGRIAVFVGLMLSQAAFALPPEHETRRLMLAVEQAIDEQRWEDAAGFINRLQTLDAGKPLAYQFYRGRVMLNAGQLNEARAALESYVTNAGSQAPHYREALKLITNIDRRTAQTSGGTDEGPGDEPVAVIEPTGNDRIERLKTLYLVGSPVAALEKHLNSLLELNAWRRGNQRVVKANEPPDIAYRVFAREEGTLNVQERRRTRTDGRAEVVSDEFAVYGVGRQVSWDCPGSERACWLYDPRDGSRWMKLADRPDAVEEIAETLGDLIRQLQSP
ncbi:hypothetical protein C8D92_101414 [Tamilnaduibacter salinus]|uniref:WRKY domain-containing protein n=1 Tax=Tamilnaduibacter salinus TaxID=1484056 RepID=A0A2A2I610_9GAMM|nr:hypothetical protein [Tamilnaduibacter salinus]PAV26473.1 hypothetical protein CF392_05425 [Tamilnaduibacter salinus]PVY79204.1 hypothetical protein C8D92_101414 [Tamilnaduibacter salinus]